MNLTITGLVIAFALAIAAIVSGGKGPGELTKAAEGKANALAEAQALIP
jgi:hypothetical protein